MPTAARLLAVLMVTNAAIADVLGQGIVDRSRRDEIVRMPDDDPAMASAFRKARATLDEFLRIAGAAPPGTRSFAVKVAVADAEETEYFWVLPFVRHGETFSGRLNNAPRLVGHVVEGQEIQFKKSEIVDWMYVDVAKRRMYGNFTACALLTNETPEEATKFRKRYGLECDL